MNPASPEQVLQLLIRKPSDHMPAPFRSNVRLEKERIHGLYHGFIRFHSNVERQQLID